MRNWGFNMLNKIIKHFQSPVPFLSRKEVKSDSIPNAPGLYGFYFRKYPSVVLDANTIQVDGFNLLYIGISPKGLGTKQTLKGRIRKHLFGDASRSTLRKSMGCVLSSELGIELTTFNDRETFGSGENVLHEWLESNMRFTWFLITEPWLYEAALLKILMAPLNLDHNEHHSFHQILKKLRQRCKKQEISHRDDLTP